MDEIGDLYKGALVGAAVGEALGATVDELPRSEVRNQFGVLREVVGGGRFKLQPGEVGDDTALALVVAQVIAENGDVDLREIAKRMVDYHATHSAGRRGAGPVTRTVLSALKPRAKDLFATAQKVAKQLGEEAAGCGPLARMIPIGMLRRVQFKELLVDTINVCRLTHYDQRCVDACIAFNFGISYLTSGKDPSKLLFKTWRFVADSRETREYRESVGTDTPKQDMVKTLRAVNSLQYEDLQSNGRAIEATQAAYWLVLNAIDFEEGLVRAVNLGGDSATLGAIAGALLGARFGEHAIPERWINQLKIRAELEAVAQKLCVLAEPKK